MSVLNKILEARKLLKVPPMEKADPRMVAAHEAKIKSALSTLQELKLKYASEIVEKGLYLLVVGELAEEAADEIVKTLEVPVYSIDAFVTKVANSVNPSNYKKRTVSSSHIDMINSVLTDIAMGLKVVQSFDAVTYNTKMQRAINTESDFLEFIKKISTTERAFSDLIAVSAAVELVDYGIEEKFDGDLMPVVLWSKNPESLKMVANLKGLGKGSFAISFGEEPVAGADFTAKTVNKTSVTNVFKQIKKQIKQGK